MVQSEDAASRDEREAMTQRRIAELERQLAEATASPVQSRRYVISECITEIKAMLNPNLDRFAYSAICGVIEHLKSKCNPPYQDTP